MTPNTREVREARDARDVEQIVAWLETNVGGKVVHIARQPRWRPVWFADVERDGDTLELCVRGDRTDTPLVFPLDHEMRFQQVADAHDIPVAKVYGWCDEPASFVMDRVPGRNDFAQATDDQRTGAMNEYMDILARLHALPVDPFVDAGILRADRREESGLLGIRRFERVYRSLKRYPDPLLEFCLGWLRRNPPNSQQRETPIVWDSGQFHQLDGKIVALLDLELAHVGDPMMDLAAFRMRDSIVGFGDFRELYARYENVTGEPVDLEAIKRHHFAFTLTNQLAFSAALKEPPAASDYMTNMQWCCETNIYAVEALAEMYDIELHPVEMPAATVTRSARARAPGAFTPRDGERRRVHPLPVADRVPTRSLPGTV